MSSNDSEETSGTIFDLGRNRALDEQPPHPGVEQRRLPKRFYKKAEAGPAPQGGEGHAILLDGKTVKTPGRQPLVVPGLPLATAIAAEWDAQQEFIDPRSMWLTKLASTAIDLVAPRRDAVIDEIAEYAGTDLLCYRANSPAALVARQAASWDPHLAWAAEQGIHLQPTSGIIHKAQDGASLAAYRALIAPFDAFRLAALHNAVTLTGSAVIGVSVALGRLSADAAFAIAHLDETWQMEVNGEDEEELARLALRRTELVDTGRFISLLD